jgi:hypothetical protein
MEQYMAVATMRKNQFIISEKHCQRCLHYSKKMVDGGVKTYAVFNALRNIVQLREAQNDLEGAVSYAEDGYNLVVEAYDCVHPVVQEAAGTLISCLITKGDLYNAEVSSYTCMYFFIPIHKFIYKYT